MHPPPIPYRVLAHAIEAGDRRLAELLAARLLPPARGRGAGRVVERVARALGLE